MSTSIVLIVAGLACLGACGVAIHRLMPHEGKPPSRWTGTDAGGTTVALGLITLLAAGLGMLLKGVFS